jgi:aerobic carbon-monoxide dehydrogenase medium subunit
LKARAFGYCRARSLDEAIGLLWQHGEDARLIAGGQSLVPALNLRLSAPSTLVDLGGIDSLRGIWLVAENGCLRLRIGAMTTHADIACSPDIARHAPLLAEAAGHVAHPAIRNRGTFGGSLAHADPSAEWPACVVALDATIHLAGPGGAGTVPARNFFLGLHETAIRPGEILTAVDIDAIGAGFRSGFAELSRRHGDYALVGIAAHGHVAADGRGFDELSLVCFSVGSVPTPAPAAAAILTDPGLDPDARIKLAQAALRSELDPPGDPQASSTTRLHLARVLLGRVVARMLDGTGPVARAADA